VQQLFSALSKVEYLLLNKEPDVQVSDTTEAEYGNKTGSITITMHNDY